MWAKPSWFFNSFYVYKLYIQPKPGVHLPKSAETREKRDGSPFKPLRIFIHYDDSVNTEYVYNNDNNTNIKLVCISFAG